MPVYVYGCTKCEAKFEQQETIANRHAPLKKKCKECKGKLEMLPAGTSIGDPIKLGATRLPGWWTDRLQNMKSKFPGSTIRDGSSMAR